MTHPFHPVFGCRFELLTYRHAWGEHRVHFYDKSGQLQNLPASWTDVVPPDPFVVIAAGRSPFHVGDLLRLADLIERLKG